MRPRAKERTDVRTRRGRNRLRVGPLQPREILGAAEQQARFDITATSSEPFAEARARKGGGLPQPRIEAAEGEPGVLDVSIPITARTQRPDRGSLKPRRTRPAGAVVLPRPGAASTRSSSRRVLRSFSEMGKLSPGDEYGELFYVPFVDCDEMPPDWPATVQQQAAAFLEAHGAELTPVTREILEVLMAMEREDGDCTGDPTDDHEDTDPAAESRRPPEAPGDDSIGSRGGRR